ncbi:YceI family protein [Bacterioplanoides sp. SCSIO 12839]|uniref:YceI family protein n=1 Tax=Bacterioplanoides sp. SCSIO 12839 TaxID=2829569 RepID=UPI002104291B|nr:YceI family protein [Bacterioplanoides sp. SCSIO 12839]UTW48365.1 YceI family protein [Bacterioplanoides sp. SCSIO 12839]
MKKLLLALGMTAAATLAPLSQAATYDIDTKGAHAFVQFKIKHLGYSWLLGRFNTFDGQFEYDASAPEKSSIAVEIETASIDSNHAERDKHLKGSDFLNVSKFPTSSFKSTGFKSTGEGEGIISGDFTLHGVTKNISFPVTLVGEGKDPWGGYRAGFEGKTTLKLSDYGITYNLGPASTHVEIELHVEGIRQ